MEIKELVKKLEPLFDERLRRIRAAIEAQAIDWGRVSEVSRISLRSVLQIFPLEEKEVSGMYALKLASRWRRLVARVADYLILIMAAGVVFSLLHVFSGDDIRIVPNTAPAVYTCIFITIRIYFALLVSHTLCNCYFLKRSGQSIGKKLMKIQIAKMDGGLPSLFTSLIIRESLLIALLSANLAISTTYGHEYRGISPVLVVSIFLFDILFIFFKERRCIHDHLASTQVCALETNKRIQP